MSEQGKAPLCWVGFDTSNYTTSAAACAVGEDGRLTVIANCKAPLPVSEGARGLRQCDAVFAHVKNLPTVTRELRSILEEGGYSVAAVGVSATPRDAADSYMPCFLTGIVAAEALAAGCGCGVRRFSHQSGHIMAALYSSGALAEGKLLTHEFFAFHVSGGTTEAVVAHPVEGGFDVELMGWGADLHAGQVVDRVGVMLGLDFPCGRALEVLAAQNTQPLPQIKTSVREGVCHLSGLENQAADLWRRTGNAPLVAAYTLTTIGKTLRKMTDQLQAKRAEGGEAPLPVVYAGGVMSNKLIRPILTKGAGWKTYFPEPAFSADNAAGIALLCALASPTV
ncbi:MAG: peptidase M22 [Clostridia bacterium]|nr:peptidase M22 [Clostridia bacterium]